MSKNGIQINKVKYLAKQDSIVISYDRTIEDHVSHHIATFDEEPAPEFFEALKAPTRPCCSIFDFEEKYENRLSPYSVSYRYNADGGMGAIVSCKLEIPSSNTCIAINTPLKKCPQDKVDSQNNVGFFSDTMVKALWAFEAEARKYLDGKRAQMSLFGEDAAVDAAEAASDEPCEEDPTVESPESINPDEYEEPAAGMQFAPTGAIPGNVVGFPTHNTAAAR